MNALYLLIPALCLIAIAYRYYSAFLAARVAMLDDTRITPAHTRYDGHNYYPLSRWVLFGHHFAAITGAGPLIGPVLAAQFGYLPGMIWLVVGVCLGGAVHDFMVLWASTRRGGRSLAEIAREEIGPVAGVTAAVAILFIIVIALAGLGLAVVNALRDSAWGTFTIAMTIPIAIVMGLYMYRWRTDAVRSATAAGVCLLVASVVAGRWVAEAEWGRWFLLNREQLVVALALYGFAASVLPVWLLLAPRDYLSAFMKIGTVAFLIGGVIVVAPTLHMPAVSAFAAGGGPIIPGKLFPFVFITIACGAISGFHALIGSGTTPKMVNRESDIRPIGYGAMLMEGVVGVVALIAASALFPGDYFGINVPPERFAALGIPEVNLAALSAQVGEDVAGRPGGAVSLAVGMAQIFTALPGMSGLMSYWYHFAIMFEALFILTTIDAGTRVARFILQEFAGRFYAPLARHDSAPAAMLATTAVVVSWAYFIYAGSISTIWPMFGIANQLLATVALAITTIVLVNAGRARYAWVTAAPLCVVAVTTISAGVLSVRDNFWPMAVGPDPALHVQGYLNTGLTMVMLACVGIILSAAALRWRRLRSEGAVVRDAVATGLLLLLLWPPAASAEGRSAWHEEGRDGGAAAGAAHAGPLEQAAAPARPAAPADPDRFEPEIRAFEAADRAAPPPQGATVFVGSSSIRRWTTLARDFPGVAVLNRGFGGSEASDVLRYLDRAVLRYAPSRVVLYAGDNDLARGKSPRQIAGDFRRIVERIQRSLPRTAVVIISVKPSLARWHLVEGTRETNALLQRLAAEDPRRTYVDVFTPMLGADGKPRPELFVEDGLHLTPEGYALWTRALAAILGEGSGQASGFRLQARPTDH